MQAHGKRRIIQISSSIDPKLGGPSSVVISATKFLRTHFDHSLIVFGQSVAGLREVEIIPTFRNNRYGFTFQRIKKISYDIQIDSDILLIHGFYLYSTLISLIAFKTRNVFLMPHGSLEDYQGGIGRLRKFIFRILLRIILRKRTIHFLLGSEPEKESILKLYPNAKITVVGLGLELYTLNSARPQRLNNPIKLLCMSRISAKKRIDLCICALEKLNSEERRYSLEIIGSGDRKLEEELRRLVSKLNLENEVKFTGFLEGENKLLALFDSDIFLLPSENENFAIAVAESIAAGKPVVVSRFVAMHEFVDMHKTGITLNSLQVEELVTAIKHITEKYVQFQNNCLDSRHLLDWEEVQKAWIRALSN